MSNIPKIDYFVVGTAKCGTSSLYNYLKEHRDVFTSGTKEPGYFVDPTAENLELYKSYYKDNKSELLAGDYSPQYLVGESSDIVASRIKIMYPKAKIIILTRNPIECALSNWRMKNTGEIKFSFKESIQPETRKVIIRRCFFYKNLNVYRNHFLDEDILTFPVESFEHDFINTSTKLLKFLDLNSDQSPESFPHGNRTIRRKNRPPKPDVDTETRSMFIEAISEDSQLYLKEAGYPADYWDVSINSTAWLPSKVEINLKKKYSINLP